MCIYCGSNKYRKIYENHHGTIPKDPDGRSWEIHHIDGNHSNNSPENLKCVSIKEHYEIHFKQGDYGACFYISKKLKLDAAEAAKLMSLSNKQRVQKGEHNFQRRLDGTSIASDRVRDGTHPFMGKGISNIRVDRTIHVFENTLSKERVNMTQYEFVRKYSLQQSQVCRLIKGKAKSTRKWIYLGQPAGPPASASGFAPY